VCSVSFAVAFGVITVLHIIFGELAPKSLAIQRPKAVSLYTAAPLIVFYYCLFPFIWTLNGTANFFLKWAGLDPAGEGEHAFSSEELEYVLSQARHSHPGDSLFNKLMIRSLCLREIRAHQIMRPSEQIVALWLDKPIDENLCIAQMSGHSRYPVCKDSDDVCGHQVQAPRKRWSRDLPVPAGSLGYPETGSGDPVSTQASLGKKGGFQVTTYSGQRSRHFGKDGAGTSRSRPVPSVFPKRGRETPSPPKHRLAKKGDFR